jgi:hypothetical protein
MTKPNITHIPARMFEKWAEMHGFKLIRYGPVRYRHRRPYQWDYDKLRN